MSTHRHIDKICIVAIVFALVISLLFANGARFGLVASAREIGYETRIFDRTKVHTVDIVMNDWDEFISTCTNEEYATCSAVIDGEAYKNIAIRAKGNTSLSSVRSMNSERYSFKIEFDHYDGNTTYHGLDKLCLNNVIQDNSYIKDFLAYTMMYEFGAAAPLCSFAYITVNGEDWGLYLAVEAVEDSFMLRNYKSAGELYKPDSMGMGGGRGNGKDFNMEDIEGFEDFFGNRGENGGFTIPEGGFTKPEGGFTMPEGGFTMPEGGFTIPEGGMTIPEGGFTRPNRDQTTSGGNSSQNAGQSGGNSRPSSGVNGSTRPSNTERPQGGQNAWGDGAGAGFGGAGGGFGGAGGGFGGAGGGFGGFGMGSSDVKLQYIDDDPSSYSTIFNSAKTNVSDADKARLIESLKSLSAYESLDSVLDIEQVISYFVVHTFVDNGDSYTGSMIHNYYLHEEDGKLSMIPWDYNLAYGSFRGSDATSSVNSPIDSPVSGGVNDRPMIGWIFSDESYTELYHAYYDAFIKQFFDSGYLADLIESTKNLIAPYVAKDPTKFCTYEQFEKGIDTIAEYCQLRAESVRGQLDGSIPSTSEAQSADRSALVDASHIVISDMGTMGMGGFGGGNRRPEQ